MTHTSFKALLLCVLFLLQNTAYPTVIEFEPTDGPLPEGIGCEILTLKDSGLNRGRVDTMWLSLLVKFTNERDSWVFITPPEAESIQYTLTNKSESKTTNLKKDGISFPSEGSTLALAPNSTVAVYAKVKKLNTELQSEFEQAELRVELSIFLEYQISESTYSMGRYLVEESFSGPILYSMF